MHPTRISICAILIALFATSVKGWNCVQPELLPVTCAVHNLSSHDLLNTTDGMDSEQIEKLYLTDFQAPSIDPWMQNHFKSVYFLLLDRANLSKLYVFPTLQTLQVFRSTVKEIVLNSDVEYLLETIYFMQTEVVLPNNMSVLKRLRNIEGDSAVVPSLNLSIFDGLSKLEEIKFSQSGISSVFIPADITLPNLTVLYLRANRIKNIPNNLNQLKQLEEIVLSANSISHVEMTAFDGLNNLRRLDLRGNSITTVTSADIINLPNLELFVLANNQLKILDVQNWRMPELQFLGLYANQMTEILNANASLPMGVAMMIDAWRCDFLEQNSEHIVFLEASSFSEACESQVNDVCCSMEADTEEPRLQPEDGH